MVVVSLPKWPKLASSGIYAHSSSIHTLLPHTKHTLNVVCGAFRKAMNRLELAEALMPCALQANIFVRRLRAKHRLFFKTSKSLVLAPTAEEVALAVPSSCAPSKQYQIQLKFRNEVRPTQVLARSFEFTMCDSYILSKNKLALFNQFKAVVTEYVNTFKSLDVAIVPGRRISFGNRRQPQPRSCC